MCVGVGGLLKSHKEREECRKSWNDFAADTKTGARCPRLSYLVKVRLSALSWLL